MPIEEKSLFEWKQKRGKILSDKNNLKLESLLNSANHALKKEDNHLKKIFKESKFKQFYDNYNQGLSYWLFETTLVYIIFKAWISLETVEWEYSYPNNKLKKCDLVVFTGESYLREKSRVKWIFESKWWLNKKTSKPISLIKKDINKIKSWKNNINTPEGRYILTFWHSKQCDLYENLEKVLRFTEKKENGVKLIYYDYFKTHYSKKEETQKAFFTMAVLKVT